MMNLKKQEKKQETIVLDQLNNQGKLRKKIKNIFEIFQKLKWQQKFSLSELNDYHSMQFKNFSVSTRKLQTLDK